MTHCDSYLKGVIGSSFVESNTSFSLSCLSNQNLYIINRFHREKLFITHNIVASVSCAVQSAFCSLCTLIFNFSQADLVRPTNLVPIVVQKQTKGKILSSLQY